ncbi:hypothetical protein AB0L41_46785 [Amycolatopsis mediterranei]|uniref:hypothetical protein n=1 Tax=Amycolatopsis mediterranei TaxID=33910 RepID=UPI003413023F
MLVAWWTVEGEGDVGRLQGFVEVAEVMVEPGETGERLGFAAAVVSGNCRGTNRLVGVEPVAQTVADHQMRAERTEDGDNLGKVASCPATYASGDAGTFALKQCCRIGVGVAGCVVNAAGGQYRRRADAVQQPGRDLTDAGRGAGDDDDPAGQVEVHANSCENFRRMCSGQVLREPLEHRLRATLELQVAVPPGGRALDPLEPLLRDGYVLERREHIARVRQDIFVDLVQQRRHPDVPGPVLRVPAGEVDAGPLDDPLLQFLDVLGQ